MKSPPAGVGPATERTLWVVSDASALADVIVRQGRTDSRGPAPRWSEILPDRRLARCEALGFCQWRWLKGSLVEGHFRKRCG